MILLSNRSPRNPAKSSSNSNSRIAGILVIAAGLAGFEHRAGAQPGTFAGNAQHTGQYSTPAQRLDRLLWSTPTDLVRSGSWGHYGAPVVTPANTVLVPARLLSGFKISAFEGGTGRLKYAVTNDYLLPTYDWLPVFNPVLATYPGGTRLYYAGAGGTVFYLEDPDAESPGPPVRLCFYTALSNYLANPSAFNTRVFVNTPLTADANGNIFFGFRIQNTAPAPLNTTNSGFARIDPDGNAIYVLADIAANDPLISRDSHNCAPALSADGSTLYVAVKGTNALYSYLLGLDSTNLTTKYRRVLRDPRNNNFASVSDNATSSPVIGPDGDVYFGVLANPANNSRGFLLHFSADLSVQKIPGGFGWDYTPAIVPASMVPGYTGPSSYLLFGKYNNYASGDGNGINRIALLDPNATQLDPHSTAPGFLEMREILTVIGCTPDPSWFGSTYPFAVREWCINTAAVNPATSSIFAPCEDGRIFRWNLADNSLSQTFRLGPSIGQPYVPTIVGPDGSVYAMNGGTLFALGSFINLNMTLASSQPDLRNCVVGQPVTFTAVVTNLDGAGPAPTGTVTFEDQYFLGLSARTNVLGTNVPLTDGIVSVTTTNLSAGGTNLGNHFITAIYSGDGNYSGASVSLVQKFHASATLTTVTSSVPVPGSNLVAFAVLVTASPPAANKPTGMVSFWDGEAFLAQIPLNNNAIATFTNNLGVGSHAIEARYASDTVFAASTGRPVAIAPSLTPTLSGDGTVRLAFTNNPGVPFMVLSASDAGLALGNWSPLGYATEFLPGRFQFSDSQPATNDARYYLVRSP